MSFLQASLNIVSLYIDTTVKKRLSDEELLCSLVAGFFPRRSNLDLSLLQSVFNYSQRMESVKRKNCQSSLVYQLVTTEVPQIWREVDSDV